MNRPARALPFSTRDLLAAAIAVWSAVGLFTVRAPWHRALGFEARGLDYPEGRIYATALGIAIFLAGYTLLARGELLRVPLLAATAIATGAVGYRLFALWRAPRTLEEIMAEVGANIGAGTAPELRALAGGEIAWGAVIAVLAAVLGLATSVVAMRKGRGKLDGRPPTP